MRKVKLSRKESFLKGLIRALGTDKDSALPLPSQAEAKPGVSTSYESHALVRTAWLEAEQAKGKAIMELHRKSTV